jgi:hypothetical protein
MLDRMDVLAPARRGTVMQWLKQRAAAGLQAVVFATLKEAPKAAGIKCVWLGDD